MENLSSAWIPPCLEGGPQSSAAPSEVFVAQVIVLGAGFSFTSFNFVPAISQRCLNTKHLSGLSCPLPRELLAQSPAWCRCHTGQCPRVPPFFREPCSSSARTGVDLQQHRQASCPSSASSTSCRCSASSVSVEGVLLQVPCGAFGVRRNKAQSHRTC